MAPLSAIIDIGSNSIRLVVYDGPERAPAILFNEKMMAGLGRSLGETGAIDERAMADAVEALTRFGMLAKAMKITRMRTVATAAVREASNGAELIARAEALGLSVELLSGEQEAEAAALGVLSAIPEADGIVGDLGGGSLELVRVAEGRVLDRASFPLGVFRLPAIRAKGPRALDAQLARSFRQARWLADAKRLPLYLVGGSWRSLARLDMQLTDYPLPIIHHYRMAPATAARLVRVLARIDKRKLRAIPGLSSSRIGTLGDAAALLAALVRRLETTALTVSAYGIREGLLYGDLSPADRAIDPLIAACRDEGDRQGRFAEHGDLLFDWLAPLFEGEAAEDVRLRHAACLLGDVAWRANPDFRAERAMETAVHGNWVGIDARGRAMMAQALFTSFGGGVAPIPGLGTLAAEDDLLRAVRWGLAIRLCQRLSGGVAGPLRRSRIAIDGGALVLTIDAAEAGLYGDAVGRRHKQLANAMGLEPRFG